MVVVTNKDMILTVFTVPETGNAKLKDPTLIWLTVVKEKTVSPPLRAKGMTSVIAPGHDQRRDLFGDD